MRFGARLEKGGTRFTVGSRTADRIDVCLFDGRGDAETARVSLERTGDAVFEAMVPGIGAGARYGLRADGRHDPGAGFWFDPAKLLVDPYALAIDRPYRYDAALSAPRASAVDTAPLVPKAIVQPEEAGSPVLPPVFEPGGLIYEVPVRAFSMLHPDVPPQRRGTLAALAEPAVIEHLVRLGVSAVELMPVTAWIDERHLPPLGLTNGWGYNPVTFMVLDPRTVPGGWSELRSTVAALRAAGIGTILDVVYNHTGESDVHGPTLSLRGLDNLASYRHLPDGGLVNDTGCGNTLDCTSPPVIELVMDTLRRFVRHAGIDGFRFDLAPVLGRGEYGFDPHAPLLRAMLEDPEIGSRVLVAEPWDIGPGGYRLGAFPRRFLEWNDRYRDDVRRFWRDEGRAIGALATRLAGSADIFGQDGAAATRTVNFIAAHDGFAMADIVGYEYKHNEANGEDNRDGHGENLSWNNGIEGETSDPDIRLRRRDDIAALLATLFASRGTIMITAGDEFGRTQRGNNNAYAQDNPITWLDWEGRDLDLEGLSFALSKMRRSSRALGDTHFLTGGQAAGAGDPDVEWFAEDGQPLKVPDWEDETRKVLVMVLAEEEDGRMAIAFNAGREPVPLSLPAGRWEPVVSSSPTGWAMTGELAARAVLIARETRHPRQEVRG